MREERSPAADEARVRGDIAKAAEWSKANDRPIFLGEFGAYDRGGSSIDERARYAATVRSATEAAGIPWAYWQFDSDFILYDIDRERWVEPIRDALDGALLLAGCPLPLPGEEPNPEPVSR